MRLIATVLGVSGVCCLTFGILARETTYNHASHQHVAVDDRRFVRRLTATNENDGSSSPSNNNIRQYSLADIDRTQKRFVQGLGGNMNSLLVYDGLNDEFKIYHMKTEDNTASSTTIATSTAQNDEKDPAYLLIDALKTKFPERFQQGQPTFQLLFSTSAHPQTDCVAEANIDDCAAESFAPILQFGSVPKEAHLLPTAKAMPFPSFASCIIDWKFGRDSSSSSDCPLHHMHLDPAGKPYSDTSRWHDLKPQVIWRGSDTAFLPEYKLNLYSGTDLPVQQAITEASTSSKLDEDTLAATLLDKFAILTPRLRALALSIFAKRGAKTNGSMPWIDAKLNADEHLDESMSEWGDSFLSNVRISQHEMAQYKYLLDLGGVGGTSHEETIAKLALPGVLFHHESLTNDWFHHENMLPWVHYIPVKMDLSDLREMWVWAEIHAHEAEAIARAGTELALRMASDSYMKSTYDSMFGDYMAKVIDAYQPGEYETVESIIAQYEADGFQLIERATCDNDRKCSWVDGEAITYVNGVSSLRKR